MIKGTISYDFDGDNQVTQLEECNMAFILGVKTNPIKEDTKEFQIQGIVLGGYGIRASSVMQILAEGIIAQIEKMHEDEGVCITYEAMKHFKEVVIENTDLYMLRNLGAILDAKENA